MVLRASNMPNFPPKNGSINMKAGGNAAHLTCAGTQRAKHFPSANQTKTPVQRLLGQRVPQLQRTERFHRLLAQKVVSAAAFSLKEADVKGKVMEIWIEEKSTVCSLFLLEQQKEESVTVEPRPDHSAGGPTGPRWPSKHYKPIKDLFLIWKLLFSSTTNSRTRLIAAQLVQEGITNIIYYCN